MAQVGRLHVIVERLDVAVAALRAGAPVIQVRVKGLPDRSVYELACRVRDAADDHGATVLINDRVDVALAAGVNGAHVGDDDLPVVAARNVLGSDAVLGATAREPRTARRHQAAGATYLGVGPAYATATKVGLPDPMGPAGIRRVADAVTIPVVAIAGVTPERVGELIEAGAYGVAVVSGISAAEDAAAATRSYLRALERAGVPCG